MDVGESWAQFGHTGDVMANYSKKRTAERVAGGFCTKCPYPPNTPEPGKRICAPCAERWAKYRAKFYAKEGREAYTTYARKKKERVAAGLCVECKNPPVTGKLRCERCTERCAIRYAKFREKQKLTKERNEAIMDIHNAAEGIIVETMPKAPQRGRRPRIPVFISAPRPTRFDLERELNKRLGAWIDEADAIRDFCLNHELALPSILASLFFLPAPTPHVQHDEGLPDETLLCRPDDLSH